MNGIIMNRIELNKEFANFNIISEKKTFFFNKIKTKIEVVRLEEIAQVERQYFQNSFYSLSIFMKDGIEHFLVTEDFPNLKDLDVFLKENSEKYNYEINELNIEDAL